MKAQGIPEREAALMTWYVGMATMVLIGVAKPSFRSWAAGCRRSSPKPACWARWPASGWR